MAKAAPVIRSIKTGEFFLSRFLELCEDDEYFVRRVCATYFPVMCKVMGKEITESRLIAPFKKLCEDNIWSVRNTCSGSLPIISVMCSEELRWNELTPMFLKMLQDSCPWVSINAYRVRIIIINIEILILFYFLIVFF